MKQGLGQLGICSLPLSHVSLLRLHLLGPRPLKRKIGQFVRSVVLNAGCVLGSLEERLRNTNA